MDTMFLPVNVTRLHATLSVPLSLTQLLRTARETPLPLPPCAPTPMTVILFQVEKKANLAVVLVVELPAGDGCPRRDFYFLPQTLTL